MIKVIMDVDTGIDDAIAIMMALQSPEIEIVGITTVSGNVSSRIAALNTLGILNIMGKQLEIPVMQGAARPLSKEKKIVHAKDVHGKKGLGNINLEYSPALLRKGKKISHFISRILANYRKKEVSLVATGPLTNIAKAIIEDPAIVDSLSRICIMGGAYGLASKVYGNITQYAEFNFYCDPAAAQIVMHSSSSSRRRRFGCNRQIPCSGQQIHSKIRRPSEMQGCKDSQIIVTVPTSKIWQIQLT
jgi:inosine-uridine nucleoside N-ribohydrolase